MLTIKELQDLGYEFKISGRKYEVTHLPPLALSFREKAHDDLVDSFSKQFDSLFLGAVMYGTSTARISAAAPQIQSIPRGAALTQTYKGVQSKFYTADEWLSRWSPRVVARGSIQQEHDRRKRSSYPQHMNIEQITELCVKLANVDVVTQRLTA